MKIIQLTNEVMNRGGGEKVFDLTASLLRSHGEYVVKITRSNKGLERSLWLKLQAFFSGIYSLSARRTMAQVLEQERPDAVHVHHLYPFFSPSVLVACTGAGVPTVMTRHDFGLTCPVSTHLREGKICELCMGGKEYWCALKNCRSNIWESVAYALRSAVARKLRYFHKNVTLFIALTKFAREHLVQAGFEGDRIFVLPNMVAVEDSPTDPFQGRYVAFAGRMSPEKGVDTLLAAGRLLPDIPVCLAGDGPMMPAVVKQVSPNATFLGRLDTQEMTAFYRSARFLVIPSRCFEMCPLVVGEAMSHGLPVIASRIGGLPELVENNVTGFLFEPGNSEDLARKVRLLWDNPDLCRKMGQAGREKAIREYNKDAYYRRLMAVYERAIEVNREQSSSGAVK